MAEGAKDQGGRHQEIKTTVEGLLSLKKLFVLEAFKNLDPHNNSDDVKAAVDEEIRILGRTNIYASISLGNLLEYYTDEDVVAQKRRGNAICHQALRLGTNGELPKLTGQFVQAYDEEQDIKVEEELGRENPQSRALAELLIKQKNLAKFREFEPVISKIVERKLGSRSRHWQPEQDQVYSGFIDLYFLFREGCSDPKNFQTNPR